MAHRLVKLIEGPYYLFLGLWVGAIVMLAFAAATVFDVVPAQQPTLHAGPYADPVLADQAGRIVAGLVVQRLIGGLGLLASTCAMGAVLCLGVQLAFGRGRMGPSWATALRAVAILGAVAILFYHALVTVPAIERHRRTMYDPAATAAQRDAARAAFEPHHQASERLVSTQALLLTLAILISPLALREPLGVEAPEARSHGA